MQKTITITAAIFGMTAIIFGAFGAHALKVVLAAEQLAAFETGVRYQMYHALFLLFIAQSPLISDKSKRTIFYLTVIGTLFFSVSIYLLSTRIATGLDIRGVGFITPIGGLLLIVAWLWLFVDFLRKKS